MQCLDKKLNKTNINQKVLKNYFIFLEWIALLGREKKMGMPFHLNKGTGNFMKLKLHPPDKQIFDYLILIKAYVFMWEII